MLPMSHPIYDPFASSSPSPQPSLALQVPQQLTIRASVNHSKVKTLAHKQTMSRARKATSSSNEKGINKPHRSRSKNFSPRPELQRLSLKAQPADSLITPAKIPIKPPKQKLPKKSSVPKTLFPKPAKAAVKAKSSPGSDITTKRDAIGTGTGTDNDTEIDTADTTNVANSTTDTNSLTPSVPTVGGHVFARSRIHSDVPLWVRQAGHSSWRSYMYAKQYREEALRKLLEGASQEHEEEEPFSRPFGRAGRRATCRGVGYYNAETDFSRRLPIRAVSLSYAGCV
ncbi:hypothetical protein B0T20DRAFT_397571 [Sordaria brevicollis]|uniref:Uncharacterized protein n=1 Tax=Sordaria brevicollis TaxID=83679 RepID=A0AAE0NVJ8_SORBR|nr:hypothetical protein B0T20DRAFT_397571 [Sordaria brevicollis]